MALPAWQQLRNAGVQGQGSAAANKAALQQPQQPAPSIPMPPASPPGAGGPGDIQTAIAQQRQQLGQPGAGGGQTPPYVDPSQIHGGGSLGSSSQPLPLGPHLMPTNPGASGGGIVNLPGQVPGFGHPGQQLGVGTDPNQMLQHAQGLPPSISMGGTMPNPGKGADPNQMAQRAQGFPPPGTKPFSLGGPTGFSGSPGQMSAGGIPPAISTMAANPAIQSVVQNILKGGGANSKGGGTMKMPPPPQPSLGGGGGTNQPGKPNPLAGRRF